MIHKCTCINKFQDKTYGKDKRVMNPCKKDELVRCTVCLKEYINCNE